jgi:hypothetical protein
MVETATKRPYFRGKLHVVGGTQAPKNKLAPVDQGCVDALAEMLAAAKSGEVIGIAYAVMYRGRHFVVNTAGELHRNPTFARGAVAALDDELRRMVWEES